MKFALLATLSLSLSPLVTSFGNMHNPYSDIRVPDFGRSNDLACCKDVCGDICCDSNCNFIVV